MPSPKFLAMEKRREEQNRIEKRRGEMQRREEIQRREELNNKKLQNEGLSSSRVETEGEFRDRQLKKMFDRMDLDPSQINIPIPYNLFDNVSDEDKQQFSHASI